MGEAVFFRNLTTKGLTAVNSGERYFEGYLTVQVKDKQGEVTIVDELMKVLPVWIDRGAPISDTHSNRIIGKGINYSKVEYKDKDGEIYPAIKVTGKIHKNYELDNDIWMKIKSGEYKGLSFGGATKSDREPMRMKDGSIAYSLKDLEHYEVAVCRDPAVPLALITEFNTLAKAAVDGVDLGGGRMMIKCDKFGCYVDKANNSEGGLKAPEARNEALVYDDKTHDQPSETPEENQKKIKKGKREHPSKEDSEAIIAGKVPGAFGDRNTDMYKKPTDLGKGEDVNKKKITYGEYCTSCGQKKPRTKRVGGGKTESGETASFLIQDDSTGTCPNCKKKGQDWSNADGDRHGMYNQDTDEGGMGKHKQKGCKCGDPKCKDPKCKKHKREVGTGYGAEENDTGEVGWSGSGSPYPKKKGAEHTGAYSFICPECKEAEKKRKKKGYEDEFQDDKEEGKDWDQQEYDKKTKKPRKKKAVITNIHTRLKNLDFMLKKEKKISLHIGGFDHDEEAYHGSETVANRRKRRIARDQKEAKENPPDISRELRALKRIQRATVTNVHSRLKNIQSRIEISDFLLRKGDEDGKNPDADTIKRRREGRETLGRVIEERKRVLEGKPSLGDEEKKEQKRSDRGSVERALRFERERRAKERLRKRKKKSYFERVKDGEFGGMNTGEVEWTEPRDTANSRTKRDKDVA